MRLRCREIEKGISSIVETVLPPEKAKANMPEKKRTRYRINGSRRTRKLNFGSFSPFDSSSILRYYIIHKTGN
jgi:hypothetical protein